MSLSQSGSQTERAIVSQNVATGGRSEDYDQLQATEERTIVAISYTDAAGADNVGGEVSFASDSTINTTDTDATKAQTLLTAYGDKVVGGMNVNWSDGEELHFHAVNNSGSSEYQYFTVYYREA